MNVRKVCSLFVQTFLEWSERRAPVYAAAIAYSTLFSLAPLLIISINLASLTFSAASFEARLLDTIEQQVGQEVADLTREILSANFHFRPSGGAALLSAVLLLFGASGVFRQLRGAINAMWHIAVRPSNIQLSLLSFVKSYTTSILAALLLGLTPISILFASAVIASLPRQLVLEVYRNDWLATLLQVFASPLVFFVLFLIVLRYLPQARASWRAIVPGAALSAIGYWIGGAILGYYIQNTAIRSIYGAAGSALALLIWAYYSAFIFLYGAKFVYSVSMAYGLSIVPHREATFVHIDFDFES
ncbi:MAG: YihY/virulence factor BrkB family protein [Caldilinea sp.]